MINGEVKLPITVSYIPLSIILKKLNTKVHHDFLYDYLNSAAYFDKWCNKKGYPQKDKFGFMRGESKLFYSEFTIDPEGKIRQPKRLNFLSYAAENLIFDPQYVFGKIKSENDHPEAPAWVQACLKLIYNEFKDYFPDKVVTILLKD
jgi:hypothetical protein